MHYSAFLFVLTIMHLEYFTFHLNLNHYKSLDFLFQLFFILFNFKSPKLEEAIKYFFMSFLYY